MTTSSEAPLLPGASGEDGERPGRIHAVPVRRPGRWVAIVVVAIVVLMVVDVLVTNPNLHWSFVFQAMIQSPVIHGLLVGTLLGTVLSMVVGVVLGITLAVMRLSDNPVLRGCAWFYIWFFRAIPRYVLLSTMGTLGYLWPHGLEVGVPFLHQIAHWFGGELNPYFANVDPNALFVGLFGGVVGLGLSEAAYMAEIARAGILSVDQGQHEASHALGMSKSMTMRRIVLPQAMRVIVPPTGNEAIGMLKDTSLLIALPVTAEMFYQLGAIGSRTFETFAVDIAAIIWYLILGSVFMAVQAWLERRFGRGFGTRSAR
ncbi:MAG TPA: amino acid ABC transporter permease [Nocardioides sp.]|nr:amino acid ABC transporter permease [Nocardioides sp.]